MSVTIKSFSFSIIFCTSRNMFYKNFLRHNLYVHYAKMLVRLGTWATDADALWLFDETWQNNSTNGVSSKMKHFQPILRN